MKIIDERETQKNNNKKQKQKRTKEGGATVKW